MGKRILDIVDRKGPKIQSLGFILSIGPEVV